MGALTSLLTATYMFRLVFLTFYGERRHDAPGRGRRHAHAAHGTQLRTTRTRPRCARPRRRHGALHDAPPAMAFALIVLAIGSVLAGYIGVPHALGGHNAAGHVAGAVVCGARRSPVARQRPRPRKAPEGGAKPPAKRPSS